MAEQDDMLTQVYDELRRIAAAKLASEDAGQTLDATALVHEAWIKLAKASVKWQDRSHFVRTAATAMRRILIDRARAKLTAKRGSAVPIVNQLRDIAAPVDDEHILQLDEALERFSIIKPEHARLVELLYFAGLSGDEAAQVLGMSSSTVDRMRRYAKAWLRLEMRSSEDILERKP